MPSRIKSKLFFAVFAITITSELLIGALYYLSSESIRKYEAIVNASVPALLSICSLERYLAEMRRAELRNSILASNGVSGAGFQELFEKNHSNFTFEINSFLKHHCSDAEECRRALAIKSSAEIYHERASAVFVMLNAKEGTEGSLMHRVADATAIKNVSLYNAALSAMDFTKSYTQSSISNAQSEARATGDLVMPMMVGTSVVLLLISLMISQSIYRTITDTIGTDLGSIQRTVGEIMAQSGIAAGKNTANMSIIEAMQLMQKNINSLQSHRAHERSKNAEFDMGGQIPRTQL